MTTLSDFGGRTNQSNSTQATPTPMMHCEYPGCLHPVAGHCADCPKVSPGYVVWACREHLLVHQTGLGHAIAWLREETRR